MTGCELLIRAKALAIRKGLDDTKVECPFINICQGTKCHLLPDEIEDEMEMEEDRLELKNERTE
jgi:hypothetical protein